ncbi:RloB family protein [Kitasatospora sp. NPDC056076]|uniref:RloB family protein n=1 Tax=Kitasatospora sp. NPDC056076 TaxID=3345703 RepID=UPI0035D66E2F
MRRSLDSFHDESRRVVLIAAEGQKTEREYIKFLNDKYGDRPGQKFFLRFCGSNRGLRPSEVVKHVIDAASSGEDEKWALFDRDSADNRDEDIPAAMRLAAKEGVQVALSHPSIELWLLLHFQPFTSQEGGLSDKIVDQLRKHPRAKGFADYDKKSGDRGKGITEERGKSLMKKEADAIGNARGLVANCSNGGCSPKKASLEKISGPGSESYEQWNRRSGHADGCDPLKRDPSTDLWRLLSMLEIGTESSGRRG